MQLGRNTLDQKTNNCGYLKGKRECASCLCWQVSSEKWRDVLWPVLRRVKFGLLLGAFTDVLSFPQLFVNAICLQ